MSPSTHLLPGVAQAFPFRAQRCGLALQGVRTRQQAGVAAPGCIHAVERLVDLFEQGDVAFIRSRREALGLRFLLAAGDLRVHQRQAGAVDERGAHQQADQTAEPALRTDFGARRGGGTGMQDGRHGDVFPD